MQKMLKFFKSIFSTNPQKSQKSSRCKRLRKIKIRPTIF